jgi:hypothetical protein
LDGERHHGRANQNQRTGQDRSEANSLKQSHMFSPCQWPIKVARFDIGLGVRSVFHSQILNHSGELARGYLSPVGRSEGAEVAELTQAARACAGSWKTPVQIGARPPSRHKKEPPGIVPGGSK